MCATSYLEGHARYFHVLLLCAARASFEVALRCPSPPLTKGMQEGGQAKKMNLMLSGSVPGELLPRW